MVGCLLLMCADVTFRLAPHGASSSPTRSGPAAIQRDGAVSTGCKIMIPSVETGVTTIA